MCLGYKSTANALSLRREGTGASLAFRRNLQKAREMDARVVLRMHCMNWGRGGICYRELFGVNLCSLFGVKLGHQEVAELSAETREIALSRFRPLEPHL